MTFNQTQAAYWTDSFNEEYNSLKADLLGDDFTVNMSLLEAFGELLHERGLQFGEEDASCALEGEWSIAIVDDDFESTGMVLVRTDDEDFPFKVVKD